MLGLKAEEGCPDAAEELGVGDCPGSQMCSVIPWFGSRLLAPPAYWVPVISFLGL